jgi:hypothetical protein
MAETKFVYAVSGVDLSEAQKARISQAIAVAVAQTLTSDSPGTIRMDYLNATNIHGGKWIIAEEAEKIGVKQVFSTGAQ